MIQQEDNYMAEWEEQHSSPRPEDTSLFGLIRNITNFASLLRVCGALVMLVAMSSYLMQGWSEGNDISRYYMLLSQTFLLAISGFGLSYVLKENKGARIFFGLGLISIAVNMTTLGALIFSTTQWGSTLVQYPSYAKWVAPEFGEIVMALLLTVAISMPVIWIGYKVLARRSAGTLSVLFLLSNMLLLVPVRETVFVGTAALIAVLLPVAIFCKRMSQDNSLRTPEGLFGMTTVLVPAGIIICRSIWFYPVDEILQIILAGVAFVTLRFSADQTEPDTPARGVIHWLSVGAAVCVATPAAILAQRYLSDASALNVFGFILAGLLMEISMRCRDPLAMVRFAAVILIVTHVPTLLFTNDMSNTVLCIAAGFATAVVAYSYGLRHLMLIGVLTALCGFGRPVIEFAQWLDFSNWITLSVSGGVIIIAASLIERHGAVLKMKWDRLARSAEE